MTDVIAVYLEQQENRGTLSNHHCPIKSNSLATAAFVESVNNAIKARTTHYFALLIADTDYLREEVRYAKTNLKLF